MCEKIIRVYIASPYTIGNKQENVETQIKMAAKLISFGYNPFWPLASHYVDLYIHNSWDTWMDLDLDWILACDCLLRLPGESKGADMEVTFALEHNIPVFYSVDELENWKHQQYD